MILILDAHALLWWLQESPELALDASAAIRDPANDVMVSAATVWELEIKRAAGKLRPPEDLLLAVDAGGFTTLPITGRDAVAAAGLPRLHADPFDRMLVAQARRLDAVIISRDAAFQAYDVQVRRA